MYGFEAKFFHLDIFELELADFLQRLDTLGFERFIVLERKNTLLKVISSLIAHKTGPWHGERLIGPSASRLPGLESAGEIGGGRGD